MPIFVQSIRNLNLSLRLFTSLKNEQHAGNPRQVSSQLFTNSSNFAFWPIFELEEDPGVLFNRAKSTSPVVTRLAFEDSSVFVLEEEIPGGLFSRVGPISPDGIRQGFSIGCPPSTVPVSVFPVVRFNWARSFLDSQLFEEVTLGFGPMSCFDLSSALLDPILSDDTVVLVPAFSLCIRISSGMGGKGVPTACKIRANTFRTPSSSSVFIMAFATSVRLTSTPDPACLVGLSLYILRNPSTRRSKSQSTLN
mmetsp:Transcript_44462/g.71268  ORF Transcript_44462/g.71268 Transcript_44462/m.71268 type:complete len:251 (+) Transcript_44462:1512-2264(+)